MYRILNGERVLSLLLAGLIAVFCCGCSFLLPEPAPVDSGDTDRSSFAEVPSALSSDGAFSSSAVSSEAAKKGVERFRYTYTEEEENALRVQLKKLNAMLDEGCDFADFDLEEQKAEEAFNHLATQSSVADLWHYMDMNSEDANADYLYCSGLRSELSREYILLYKRIYESSLQKEFFADWTEDDISDMLRLADTYSEKVVELLEQYDRIRVDYGNFDSESATFDDDVAALYAKQIGVLNTLAMEMGHTNFYDYAYPYEYDRDYSADEVETFRQLVRKYLPRLIKALSCDIELKAASFSSGEIRQLNSILFGDMNRYQLVNRAKTFYEKIGGDNRDIFQSSLLEEENFILCDSSNSFEGAFTMYLDEYETPVIFYGPGYHNVFTFLHESGHYCAFQLANRHAENEETDTVTVSNDLCEIHSQGAEWLYLSMIAGDYSEELYDYIVEYRLFCDLAEVLFCTAIDAFEERCYREAPSSDRYDEIMKEVCNGLGGYDFLCELMGTTPCEYWRLVTVENPVYYISYPVSLLPSIELFLHAVDDEAAAISEYKALFGPDRIEFLPSLAEAGLSTPFEKNLFEGLTEYINERILK